MNSTTSPATDQDLRDTIRQMLADWNAASEADRVAALAAASAAADCVGCACPNMHGPGIYCHLPADDELYILDAGMGMPDAVVPACGWCSDQSCA